MRKRGEGGKGPLIEGEMEGGGRGFMKGRGREREAS